MTGQGSKIKLFLLLVLYCVGLFVFLAFFGTFAAVVVHYFKSGDWEFTKIDIFRLVLGALAYALPVAVGVWILYLLKERKRCKTHTAEEDRKDG
ncbi:hypothetical protein BFW87_24650 [Pseudomonas fluorescens]|uniref:Transmembrane protein n=1 Tax=Pseudomonas fluorescens TaxID=294 RepID=A0A1T2Y304_PSEFL|nr:hypothetical protein [Pseudomonas fluorescens]OPA86449.1 hypothetical protein BFW87_24650 [Pseudomonas fluorescens]